MPPTEDRLAPRLELARQIAVSAGQVTLDYFRRANLQVERKADDSPVTVADREAEQHLRKAIEEAFPDDAILGEELGETSGDSGYRWVLDPIDGTKSFIHGVPLYTTLVAVEREERGVVGVIHAPAAGETVYAAEGGGAWHVCGESEPVPARVSQVGGLADALLLTTEVASFRTDRSADAVDAYLRLDAAARLVRTWGDAFGYLLVATGRAEVMLDAALNVWDAAAVQPVLIEAGGSFTDWQGRPTIHGGEGIGTNGRLLEEVLAITRGA